MQVQGQQATKLSRQPAASGATPKIQSTYVHPAYLEWLYSQGPLRQSRVWLVSGFEHGTHTIQFPEELEETIPH